MLGEKAMYNRLKAHFQENYGEYDLTANWHPDSTDNTWKCDINEIDKEITFTCDAKSGRVTETYGKITHPDKPSFGQGEDIYVKNILLRG